MKGNTGPPPPPHPLQPREPRGRAGPADAETKLLWEDREGPLPTLWAGVYLETPKSHMGPHVWGRGG